MVYTIDQIKEKIVPVAKQYDLSKIYLFGSYARGEADGKSNIDILLVSDLLSPKTNIGKLVKKNFLNDREVIYEKSIS